MTEDPGHPPRPAGGATGPVPADRTLTAPVDPWIGTAPVATPAYGPPHEPIVLVVERPRRRRWPWIVGGLAVLTLLCTVIGAAIWAPIGREYPARLELGDSVAGFERVRDPDIDKAAAQIELQMFRDYDADDGLAAMLEDPQARERRLILLVATKLIFDPGKELSGVVRGLSDRPVRNVTDYRRLGPALTCADTEDDQSQAVIVCAWVDHGSVGLGIFYGPWTMDEAATALRDIRGAVVRRG